MDDHDDDVDRQPDEWATDPLANYSVGPDDAGNIVMHGIGFLVKGWRWLAGKFSNQT